MKTVLSCVVKYTHLVFAIIATILILPLNMLYFVADLFIILFIDCDHLMPDQSYNFLEPINDWLWKYKKYTWVIIRNNQ